MTREEKITCIATDLMGWESKAEPITKPLDSAIGALIIFWWDGDKKICPVDEFKPDEDENHFAMVLKKIMERGYVYSPSRKYKSLFFRLCEKFNDNLKAYMQAPLPERLDAVVAVLSDSPSSNEKPHH